MHKKIKIERIPTELISLNSKIPTPHNIQKSQM